MFLTYDCGQINEKHFASALSLNLSLILVIMLGKWRNLQNPKHHLLLVYIEKSETIWILAILLKQDVFYKFR